MSAKYERIKKADLNLPAPLRWLTRAFSSITMAVILLSLVVLYGTIASVPIFFLVLGALYIVAAVLTVGGGLIGAVLIMRKATPLPMPWRVSAAVGSGVVGVGLCFLGCWGAYIWTYATPWLAGMQTEVIYRLPYFEMTRMQFYAWWPLQTILILFVLNLIWATFRRIPFRFEYLGVLTVHCGIVIMAVGAIVYGHYRVEGDTILLRADLGGGWVHSYYDAVTPALYVTNLAGEQLMVPLKHLPRYNDYPVGDLHIDVDEAKHYDQVLPKNLHVTIPGFLAYARMETVWKPADQMEKTALALATSPAIELQSGDKDQANGSFKAMLLAGIPDRRVLDLPAMSIEYLVAPTRQRIDELMSAFQGPHGLVVDIPGKRFHEVYAIHTGATIKVGGTGYTLKIGEIGPYEKPFTAPGYAGAQDERAVVRVSGSGTSFTRICLARYPKKSHNIDSSDKPAAAGAAIHLTYLDASKARFYILASKPGEAHPLLIVRLPGKGDKGESKPMEGRLDGPLRFPFVDPQGQSAWMHITKVIAKAAKVDEPDVVPKNKRKPKKEGNYSYALLPVKLTLDRPAAKGGVWRKIVWLRHMQYPRFPDSIHKPVTVDVPSVGPVKLAFSRQRRELPFEVKLASFKMTPYPGSQIPKNFASTLWIKDLGHDGLPVGKEATRTASLNNPIVYYPSLAYLGMDKVKISQIGWDAPSPGDPGAFAKDADGRYINQQRYTILGIGNNVCIHVIALGAIMIFVGIPWAFYIKPWIVQRRGRKVLRERD